MPRTFLRLKGNMRKFSSYGLIDKTLHYYAPRRDLIARTGQQLLGQDPDRGGHYITVWAPRQTGKSWLMREVLLTLRQNPAFDVLLLSLQHLKRVTDVDRVAQFIARELIKKLSLENVNIETLDEFQDLFAKEALARPLILILDEFDALPEEAISGLAGVFRNIYLSRQVQVDKPTAEKDYLLHGLALIGVRAVLGVENITGSPFNVQQSLHIPNLTFAEVAGMFEWYEQDSGQKIEQAVIEQIFYEFQGQPGLTCWFGELLTETYNEQSSRPITMDNFAEVYGAALQVLPNNNIRAILHPNNTTTNERMERIYPIIQSFPFAPFKNSL